MQEKCPYIFENIHNDSLSSLTLLISDQELIKDDQVQELATLKIVAV